MDHEYTNGQQYNPNQQEPTNQAAPFSAGGTEGSQYHYSDQTNSQPAGDQTAYEGHNAYTQASNAHSSDPQDAAYTPVGEASYTSHNQTPPKKQHPAAKRWGTRALALLLVAAVAFGGGYAGTALANAQGSKVVIRQAQTTVQGDSEASATGTLTSTQVAQTVSPSVVAITTEKMVTTNTWFGGHQIESGAGSGVIISEDGYILTCAHVINGADTIQVELSDGTNYSASLVGSYVNGDIAVIKIEATGLTPATIGDSSAIQLGEPVWAVGNPEGTLSGTVTDGIISSLDRQITVQLETDSSQQSGFGYFGSTTQNVTLNCIQMSAQVSPGNSGGGLFNSKGELIGIVNAKSSGTNAEGLGFAIPSNTAIEIATQLMEQGSYTDPNAQSGGPVLGITAVYLTQQQAQQYGYTSAGVYVYEVNFQSTAEAGLTSGDRIISVDGSVISQIQDISDILAEKSVGDQVELSVERGGQMVDLTITLVESAS